MWGVSEEIGPNITLTLASPNGYYIHKSTKVGEVTITKYLSLAATWEDQCTNGWFHRKEEAMATFRRALLENAPDVTPEDLHWEDRES